MLHNAASVVFALHRPLHMTFRPTAQFFSGITRTADIETRSRVCGCS